MIYYTVNIEILEQLSPSALLKEMKDGATRWGEVIGKKAVERHKIKRVRKQYYMKVGYES
jgi:RNase P protein component